MGSICRRRYRRWRGAGPDRGSFRTWDRAWGPGVVALWEQCIAGNLDGHNEPHRSIQRKMAVQGELFFVARREGRIVGTTMAGYDGHRGWIYSVAVSPESRRSGIGRALLQHAET